MSDERPEAVALLATIKAALPELRQLYEDVSSHWIYEDGIYRFYHQSFKVFYLQHQTGRIARALAALRPEKGLNGWFAQIVNEGTGKEFSPEANGRWLEVTRPIVEAFFHARFMLEMVIKGGELEIAPSLLPSGWATVLYLYGLR
jgi:hypothetical protein